MTNARTLQVRRVVNETHDAFSIVLEQPDDPDWTYKPGQFLTFRVPSDQTGSVARCYSISSSPFLDEELQVTVRRTPDGYGSNWLAENVVEGTALDVLPPKGQFTPSTLDQDMLLLAAGSGITPVFSILRSALVKGSGDIILLYAVRGPGSIIFERQLKDLVDRYESRLHVYYWVESRQGLPTKEFLATTIEKHGSRHIYVCGPAGFMSLATTAAHSVSHPRDQMHLEVFVSLKGDPFADEVVVAVEPDHDDPADSTPVEVEINGETLNLDWSPKQTLVELLLAKNVDVPFLCRDGECGTCQATIERGAVSMDRNDVLEPEDVADGYVLTCQARPDGSDPIRIVY